MNLPPAGTVTNFVGNSVHAAKIEFPCFAAANMLCSGQQNSHHDAGRSQNLIKACANQMDARYGRTVFDEWAVVSLAENKARVLAYIGPRNDDFLKNFVEGSRRLARGIARREIRRGRF